MEKCTLCGRKKAARDCPGLGGKLCSACCGTQRQKAIKCPEGCDILKASTEYRLAREVRTEVTDRIGDTFRTRRDEILDRPDVEEFSDRLERSFIRDFYHDESVKDGDIRSALERIYAFRTGKIASLVIQNRPEELVFAAWEKTERDHPDLSGERKTAVLLRIVKSIRDCSGGALGDHGYLKMLHDELGLSWPSPDDEEAGADTDEWDCEEAESEDGEGADGEQEEDEDEDEDGTGDGWRASVGGDVDGLHVTSLAGATAMVLDYAEAEEPEEVKTARRMFRKEFGWLAKHIDKAWSDPVMEGEFALWFCTEYDFLGCGRPAEMFWRERREGLDEGTRALVNALRRSIWSTFLVTGRDGREYRMIDCRSGYEHLVRTVDFSGNMEKGDVVVGRIAWNAGANDRSYVFLGVVLPMEKEAAEVTSREAAADREEAAGWREAFIGHFGRADPVFLDGNVAYGEFSDFRDKFLGKKAGGKRGKGADELPTEQEMWEMTVGPWEDVIDGEGPVALMFESDGLHASTVYPGLLRALEGRKISDVAARKAVRRAVEDEDEIPLTSLRRLLEEHADKAVQLLSSARPEIRCFEDVKRLVERRRAEPFDLTPAVNLDLCAPPDAPAPEDGDGFEVKMTSMKDGQQTEEILYHMRTGRCPYTKGECAPGVCPTGGMADCPVHRGETVG